MRAKLKKKRLVMEMERLMRNGAPLARRALLAGGVLFSASAHAELPVPVTGSGFVSAGDVLAPVINGNQMLVKQRSTKAITNWRSFNVSADAGVEFQQASKSAIMLARIRQQDPSRILGQVNANGQLFLVNPNGFVFGAGARVNANSFAASTLNIKDALFNSGSLASAAALDNSPAQSEGYAAFAVESNLASGMDAPAVNAAIRVESGARLQVGEAGQLFLIAPDVENAGSLRAGANGQVVLAGAHDRVYVSASKDENLRGYLVEVGAQGGSVSNTGKVFADRGNITLVGDRITQAGELRSTTSVAQNGSITLAARSGARRDKLNSGIQLTTTQAGELSLAQGSSTEVLNATDARVSEEYTAQQYAAFLEEMAVDETVQKKSRIQMQARKIEIEARSLVRATGGNIAASAVIDPSQPAVGDGASLRVASGAVLDASGASASIEMARNLAQVQLLSEQLKDSPLLKNSDIKGKTVTVDLRKGTALADISGAAANVKRDVNERTLAGGTISLSALGALEVNSGALLDVSGGQLEVAGGMVNTTKFWLDGKRVDIADADPNQRYQGIVGSQQRRSQKWGSDHSYGSDNGLDPRLAVYEAGYVEGRDAGGVVLSGRQIKQQGELRAGTVHGTLQRTTTGSSASNRLPQWGLLQVGLSAPVARPDSTLDYLAPDLALWASRERAGAAAEGSLSLYQDELLASGFSRLELASEGDITLGRDGDTLSLATGGKLGVVGGRVALNSRLRGAGAEVSLTATDAGGRYNLAGSKLHLADGVGIDVSGNWSNDVQDGASASQPLALNAGKISLQASGSSVLSLPGELSLRADGGAWLGAAGKLSQGKGGDIALGAVSKGGDRNASFEVRDDGRVRISSLGLSGGKLSLTARDVVVGASDEAVLSSDAGGRLQVGAGLFSEAGFSSVAVRALGGALNISDRRAIQASQPVRDFDTGARKVASGADLADVSRTRPAMAHERKGIAIQLSQDIASAADPSRDLVLGAGVRIDAGTGGSIAIANTTHGQLRLGGSLRALAGSISLTASRSGDKAGQPLDPRLMVLLDDGARLDVSGTFKPSYNNRGLNTGSLLAAGQVTLDSDGAVVIRRGAQVDASGATAQVDLLDEFAPGINGSRGRTTLASDAGRVAIRAGEGMVWDGTILAGADNARGAEGGRLELTLKRDNTLYTPDVQLPTGKRVIELYQTARPALAGFDPAGGQPLPPADNGVARLSVEQLQQTGLAALTLSSENVKLAQPLDLSLSRELAVLSPVLQVAPGVGEARLAAQHVMLGSVAKPDAAPAAGTGVLRIEAESLDLANQVIAGTHQTHIDARGDIRSITEHSGLFANGLLDLSARQIYPSSLSTLRLAALDNPAGAPALQGQLRIRQSGRAPAPVASAGGTLALYGHDIEQSGSAKAPQGLLKMRAEGVRFDGLADDRLAFTGQQGSLKLAPGSLSSVSGEGQTVLLGRTSAGQWVFGAEGNSRTLADASGSQLPEKNIVLEGASVQVDEGASVDLRGGGEIAAYEWIQGIGGSRDILADGGVYAILPGQALDYLPYDFNTGMAGRYGDRVYLTGGPGLAAGEYALLPARYALLPGAKLVRPVTGYGMVAPGQGLARSDGTTIVQGERRGLGRAGTAGRFTAYQVYDAEDIALRAEYRLSAASSILQTLAARQGASVGLLARDAGGLAIKARDQLALKGNFLTEASGRGARVDINAERLALLDAPAERPGEVVITDEDIRKLRAESVLLGGERRIKGNTTEFSSTAERVQVGSGVRLSGVELLFMGRQDVVLDDGAVVLASGQRPGSIAQHWSVRDDGAFIGVTANALADFDRVAPTSTTAGFSLAQGATLGSSGSMVLNTTGEGDLRGDMHVGAGLLDIGSASIHLGDAPSDSQGVVLQGDILARLGSAERLRLHADDLWLHADDLWLHTGANLASGDLGLDIKRFNSDLGDGQQARFSAQRELRLENSRGDAALAALPPAELNGTLLLQAKDISLGQGSTGLVGFDALSMEASRAIVADAKGGIASADQTDFNFRTPLMTHRPGGDLRVNTAGDFRLDAHAAPVAGGAVGYGGRSRIQAASIDIDAMLASMGGDFSLLARQGDLRLSSHARLAAGGGMLDFRGVQAPVQGGQIVLRSEQGLLIGDAAARLDLSSPAGSDAGQLRLEVPNGRLDWQATTVAHHATDDAGGELRIDAGQVGADSQTGLNTLLGTLNAAGFDQALSLRLRDSTLDTFRLVSDLRVRERASIAFDAGTLALAADIDASGTRGGEIRLSAQGIALERGVLSARGSAGEGGQVWFEASDGRISQSAGQRIDVAGATAEQGGRVHLLAAQEDGADGVDLKIDPLLGQIEGAELLRLVGQRRYSDIDATAFQADADALMGRQGDILARLNLASRPGARLAPGWQVESAGDITLDSSIDFDSWSYGGQRAPGELTLRAAGNISLEAGLSDGIFRASTGSPALRAFDQLRDGWSGGYRIVAGADLGSVDVREVLHNPLAGSISLADNVRVRTGTGDIGLHAAGDVLWGSGATVYSAGRRGFNELDQALSSAITLENRNKINRWLPIDGGDVVVGAGGALRGSDNLEQAPSIADWLVAVRTDAGAAAQQAKVLPGWFVDLGKVKHNAAAIGGGDLRVAAAGDAERLSLSAPSTGRWDRTSAEVERFGLGNIDIRIGGDVLGGQFNLGDGQGRMRVAGALREGWQRDGAAVGALFGVQGGHWQVQVGRGASLAAVYNPTLMANGTLGGITATSLSSYGEGSGLSLASLYGDVALSVDGDKVSGLLGGRVGSESVNLLPGSLQLAALNGNLSLSGSANTLAPTRAGQLALLAGRGISLQGGLAMSDDMGSVSTAFGAGSGGDAPTHLPLHTQDGQAALMRALNGNIDGGLGSNPLLLSLPKALDAYASGDIRDVILNLQHPVAAISSKLEAGRDLRFDQLGTGITLQGPGNLFLLAGRDLSLSPRAEGIASRGNLDNAALDDRGAAIHALAGLNGHAPNWAGFLAPYFDTPADERDSFGQALRNYVGSASTRDALTGFARMSPEQQSSFRSRYGEPFERLLLATGLAEQLVELLPASSLAGALGDVLIGAPAARAGLVQAIRSQRQQPALSEEDALALFALQPADERGAVLSQAFGQLAEADARALLAEVAAGMSGSQRDELASRAFFRTLEQANLDFSALYTQQDGDYLRGAEPGYRAIERLFGEARLQGRKHDGVINGPWFDLDAGTYGGDILMEYSTLQSNDGGDLNLYAVGGQVRIGGFGKPEGVVGKEESDRGLIGYAGAAARVYAHGDIWVNGERWMTLGGGTLQGWSSTGVIDAGRGAKDSLSVPPPVIRFDENGRLVVEPPAAVAGSGIRTLCSDNGGGEQCGRVALFAKRIDANEAGIAPSYGDLPELPGIKPGLGGVAGAEQSPPPPPPAAGTSGLAGATAAASKAAENAAGSNAPEEPQLSELAVDVVGFGSEGDMGGGEPKKDENKQAEHPAPAGVDRLSAR